MAVAATALLVAPACAQDEPRITQVAMNTDASTSTATAATTSANMVEISNDAHFEADAWVVDHRDRLAVAVRIGADTEVPLERIEAVLRNDFAENGVQNVRVYFEVVPTSGGSAVSYHTDEYVSDFYPLATAREHVAEMARRLRFDQQLASNMN